MSTHFSSADELLTIPEVTKALRVSKTTVLRLVNGDRVAPARLPAIRIGRRILVRRQTLEAFVRHSEGLDSAA
jgi:excisionase family DNA binding protein